MRSTPGQMVVGLLANMSDETRKSLEAMHDRAQRHHAHFIADDIDKSLASLEKRWQRVRNVLDRHLLASEPDVHFVRRDRVIGKTFDAFLYNRCAFHWTQLPNGWRFRDLSEKATTPGQWWTDTPPRERYRIFLDGVAACGYRVTSRGRIAK